MIGDEIDTTEGGVLIDGRPADEPYLAPGTVTDHLTRQEIPARQLFVMGGNRANSEDSRMLGPLPTDDVVALVDT